MTSRPVGGERGEAQLEAVAEDGVEDDRRAELGDLLVVVGERLGAELAKVVVLRSACGRVDLPAEVAADVDRRLACPARARLHEQTFALLQPRVGETCPGGLVGDAEAGRARCVERVRDGADVLVRRRDELRVCAERAAHEHALARVLPRAGPVHSGGEGRLRSGPLGRLALVEVEVVDPRGLEPDEHLPVGRSGVGDLFVPEDFGPAAFVDNDRLHALSFPQIHRS